MIRQLRSHQVHDWLLPGSHSDPQLLHADVDDRILVCHPDWGRGYRQEIPLREELSLLFIDYTFNRAIVTDAVGAGDRIEFEFHLAGNYAGYSLCIPCFKLRQFGVRHPKQRVFKVEIFFKGSALVDYAQSFIERLSPEAHTAAERILKAVYTYQGGDARATIARMLRQVFGCSSDGPSNVKRHMATSIEQILSDRLYTESFALNYATYSPITAPMQKCLEQILSCPYQSIHRLNYLEKKALALVDLRLNALLSPAQDYEASRIHDAAALLRSQMLSPPSLASLARQVGTNRLKLNQGFHTLYGTAPFGYLRSHRLSQAKRLLMTSELSIDQIAEAVGYSSRSRFATAFRQRMGLNPKTFQRHVWQDSSVQ